jgi:hypothetical protein
MVADEPEHKKIMGELTLYASFLPLTRIWIGGMRTPDDNNEPKDSGSFIWLYGEPWKIPPCSGAANVECSDPGIFWGKGGGEDMPNNSGGCVQYAVDPTWTRKGLNDHKCSEFHSFLCELKQ